MCGRPVGGWGWGGGGYAGELKVSFDFQAGVQYEVERRENQLLFFNLPLRFTREEGQFLLVRSFLAGTHVPRRPTV